MGHGNEVSELLIYWGRKVSEQSSAQLNTEGIIGSTQGIYVPTLPKIFLKAH
jgi:hypothetical protein